MPSSIVRSVCHPQPSRLCASHPFTVGPAIVAVSDLAGDVVHGFTSLWTSLSSPHILLVFTAQYSFDNSSSWVDEEGLTLSHVWISQPPPSAQTRSVLLFLWLVRPLQPFRPTTSLR